MKKIKIELKPITNKVVKYGKEKIEVKPYISAEDIVIIGKMCVEQFDNAPENFGMIKCLFDMLVVDKCTNVEIEGISSKNNKDRLKVSVDINSSIINKFESSRIIDVVAPCIINYKEAYEQILKYIEFSNARTSMAEFSRNLPDNEKIMDTMQTSMKALTDLKAKDPAMFDKIVAQSLKNEAIETGLFEYKSDKKKTKIKK